MIVIGMCARKEICKVTWVLEDMIYMIRCSRVELTATLASTFRRPDTGKHGAEINNEAILLAPETINLGQLIVRLVPRLSFRRRHDWLGMHRTVWSQPPLPMHVLMVGIETHCPPDPTTVVARSVGASTPRSLKPPPSTERPSPNTEKHQTIRSYLNAS